MSGYNNIFESYAPFVLSMLASAGVGALISYFFLRKPEMTTDEIASVFAKRAKQNPSVLQPITGVYQYMMKKSGLTYFPGPQNGAPGFFASPFKPSFNGGVAHVLCKKDNELFYLISIKNCVLDDRSRENIADLPAGFLNSGNASELARTQDLIKRIGDERKNEPDLNYEQYKSLMLNYSQSFDSKSTVQIDETLEEGVRRACAEQTGVFVQESGLFLNILNVNHGSQLIAHVLYLLESENLPQLKPQMEEGASRSAWVNVKNINLSITSSGEYQGYILIGNEQYRIKPYDLIAEHIYKVLHDIAPSNENFFSPSTHYYNTRYEPKIV